MHVMRVLLCSLLIVATTAKGANLTMRLSRQSAAKAVLDAARQKEPFPGVTWRPGVQESQVVLASPELVMRT